MSLPDNDTDVSPQPPGGRKKILLVGPGFFFLGGLSVYTCRLANALCESHDVSVLLLNRLIPTALYPGGHRAGHDLSVMRYDPRVRVIGQIDWHWGTSVFKVTRSLRREAPDIMVLQWWTAATLHTYLLLAKLAAAQGTRVIAEFHEVQDTGEARLAPVAAYCRRYLRRLVDRVDGAIFHNTHDVDLFESTLGSDALAGMPVEIAPHGPYDHIASLDGRPVERAQQRRTRLLFFGLIRPYKGLEDLVYAVDGMSEHEADQFEVTIVGETWENWQTPAEAIENSRYRDRITFHNRYVSDTDAAALFHEADVLVLPYRRGSASGPLQIAMNFGIHVVLYAVGGLVEAVRDYEGATLVAPNDVDALRQALLAIGAHRAERFADPHSWAPVQTAIERLAAYTGGHRQRRAHPAFAKTEGADLPARELLAEESVR